MISQIGILVVAAFACTANALPPCVCTRDFTPVCGNDGETYPNQCMMECARANGKTNLALDKKGPCTPEEAQKVCICTFEYKPICGSDGKSYSNPCEADCNNAQVAHYGNCEDVKVVKLPPCTCTKEKQPVCGSDGKTYSNPCLLNCATAANSQLSIQHSGSCQDSVKVVDAPKQNSCTCTRNFKPVCGSNGQTYSNECLLKCAGQTKSKEGACDE